MCLAAASKQTKSDQPLSIHLSAVQRWSCQARGQVGGSWLRKQVGGLGRKPFPMTFDLPGPKTLGSPLEPSGLFHSLSAQSLCCPGTTGP